MNECVRTHVSKEPIDVFKAAAQHEAYCGMLEEAGATVERIDANADHPDSVFIEDNAIVLDEIAVLASMGTVSRRTEPSGIVPALERHREIYRIESPATIEGGDVLRVGRRLLVGLSSRTNRAGAERLEDATSRFGYAVTAIPIDRCLHLKSACTALPDGRLLINPDWIDRASLNGFDWIEVPKVEPWGANVALVGSEVCLAASHVETAETIRQLGFAVRSVDVSEFAKAEGCVTCMSLLFT